MRHAVVMALVAVILLAAMPAGAQQLRAAGGPTILDGDMRAAGELQLRGEEYAGVAGMIGSNDTGYLGAMKLIDMGEVTLELGVGVATRTNERIRQGGQFILGASTTWGPFAFTARHISNGARVFDHGRKPNSGENMLLIGTDF